MPSHRGDLPAFERQFFGAGETFTRIGAGGIGGKAAGLEFVRREVLPRFPADRFPEIEVAVPTLTVLGTGLFESFMERNDLRAAALSGDPDERIAHAFQRAEFPAEFVGDLRALITGVTSPLAVRSSSLLEDDLAHPFAGVYATKMIPNNQHDVDTRFRRLVEAVKFVWASTYFRAARSYLRSLGKDPESERMAAIVQEVVGRRHGERYYPSVSGVARSYNYYPSGRARPEEGVVNLALGLGKEIVDGGVSWTYSPAHPHAPAPFKDMGALLENTQTGFWAVNMGRPPLPDPIHETEYLVRGGLPDAEADGTLEPIASTYDAASDRLRPGMAVAGPRVLDFAPLRDADDLPLNDAVKALLAAGEEASGSAVEIEFALDLPPRDDGVPARLGFLQMRPMRVGGEGESIPEEALAAPDVLLASENVLGHGSREGIQDVVYVRPDRFDARHTQRIAQELEGMNRDLMEEGRFYMLIGFGRWGSTDPWLGIPVEWGQVSGARVLVESNLPGWSPDVSQGSHFFHNLIGCNVLFMAVPHGGPHAIDWAWLEAQETVRETEFTRHVRTPRPLLVQVDGRGRRGFVRHP